ncbi:hypothetical protein PTSG_10627 [Salpingoeca rosetta]|uniref:Uncharacterized protein n=1 Tax=Salpingoeca rosetta (strain ATCC 50818 / BSB-021) TaxID=946362 RepID=F2URW7_SALR5|nr:uncharacterized protein PTSG_10627 [Salpingoeca rosetta]EGD80372.1 hypothetical protein PTSG_10627 [Salpingoeca rosetta]|eukprot:XP_004988162.1 hypothetical protein PTSG_10627 [Salpingoeca rosetta]
MIRRRGHKRKGSQDAGGAAGNDGGKDKKGGGKHKASSSSSSASAPTTTKVGVPTSKSASSLLSSMSPSSAAHSASPSSSPGLGWRRRKTSGGQSDALLEKARQQLKQQRLMAQQESGAENGGDNHGPLTPTLQQVEAMNDVELREHIFVNLQDSNTFAGWRRWAIREFCTTGTLQKMQAGDVFACRGDDTVVLGIGTVTTDTAAHDVNPGDRLLQGQDATCTSDVAVIVSLPPLKYSALAADASFATPTKAPPARRAGHIAPRPPPAPSSSISSHATAAAAASGGDDDGSDMEPVVLEVDFNTVHMSGDGGGGGDGTASPRPGSFTPSLSSSSSSSVFLSRSRTNSTINGSSAKGNGTSSKQRTSHHRTTTAPTSPSTPLSPTHSQSLLHRFDFTVLPPIPPPPHITARDLASGAVVYQEDVADYVSSPYKTADMKLAYTPVMFSSPAIKLDTTAKYQQR